MKKALIFLSVLALTPLLAAEAGNPGVPYGNAQEALTRGAYSDAAHWFAVTYRDFPKTREGKESLLHETMLTMAKELASLRLAAVFREGTTLGRLEKADRSPQAEKAAAYEKDAREALGKVQKLTKVLFASAPLSVPLKFRIKTEGWEVTELREKVRKGELPDEADLEKLEQGEFVTNYIGVIATVLDQPEGELVKETYEGRVWAPALFNAIGARLQIASESRPDEEQKRLAKACFARVLELTEKEPYDKHRQRAVQFMEKLGPVKNVPAVRCPVCKKEMETGWKFCPFDGTKVKGKK